MKRNLLAIFLAVMVIAALVLIVAPGAKAETPSNMIIADTNDQKITISQNGKILDLKGKKNVVVNIAEGITLSVIDTAFLDQFDLTGSSAGTLTVEGAGKVNDVYLHGDYRYLKVENKNQDGTSTGTYSFHPFNLTITGVGLNTLGPNGSGPVICIRTTFIANDVVKAMLDSDTMDDGKLVNDFGLKKVSGTPAYVSAKSKYSFGNFNGIQAFFDLNGSLNSKNLDSTLQFRAYIKIGDVEILSNNAPLITPRTILKGMNKTYDRIHLTAAQKSRLATSAAKDTTGNLDDLFTGAIGGECNHAAEAVTCQGIKYCKNCDEVRGFDANNLITGHRDGQFDMFGTALTGHEPNGFCDLCVEKCKLSIGGINDFIRMSKASLPGTSKTWEISGQMVRPAGDADGWNFGFDIYAGSEYLSFSATTNGIVFESTGSNSRYPYHAFSTTQYNIDDSMIGYIADTKANLDSAKKERKTSLFFKAIIKDDIFYAYFGESMDSLKLSWIIPLTEVLGSANTFGTNESDTASYNKLSPTWDEFITEDVDTESRLFPGFKPGSEYRLALHINRTKGSGSVIDLQVKTNNVDTIPELKYIANDVKGFAYGDMDYAKGTLTSRPFHETNNPDTLNKLTFVGTSQAWTISGNMATDNAPQFGFVITSGDTTFTTPLHDAVSNFKAAIVNDVLCLWWNDTTKATPDTQIKLTDNGFAAGSRYKVGIITNNDEVKVAKFSNLTVETKAPNFVEDTNNGKFTSIDATTGTLVNVQDGSKSELTFVGSNTAWEISGTAHRDGTDSFCFGFVLGSGDQTLAITTVTSGIVFGDDGYGNYNTTIKNSDNTETTIYHDVGAGYDRYPYYAWGGAPYVNDTNIEKFTNTCEEDTVNFKVVIVDNMLYAWFWYDGKTPAAPSWQVPLTEALAGKADQTWANYFKGFTGNNPSFDLTFYLKGTKSVGTITNLTVKNGEAVDRNIYAEMDIAEELVFTEKTGATGETGEATNVKIDGLTNQGTVYRRENVYGIKFPNDGTEGNGWKHEAVANTTAAERLYADAPFALWQDVRNNFKAKGYQYVAIDFALSEGATICAVGAVPPTYDTGSADDGKVVMAGLQFVAGGKLWWTSNANNAERQSYFTVYSNGKEVKVGDDIKAGQWYTVVIKLLRDVAGTVDNEASYSDVNFSNGNDKMVYFSGIRYYMTDGFKDAYVYENTEPDYVEKETDELVVYKHGAFENYDQKDISIYDRTSVYGVNFPANTWDLELVAKTTAADNIMPAGSGLPTWTAVRDNFRANGYQYIAIDFALSEGAQISVAGSVPPPTGETLSKSCYLTFTAGGKLDWRNTSYSDKQKSYFAVYSNGKEIKIGDNINAGQWYTVVVKLLTDVGEHSQDGYSSVAFNVGNGKMVYFSGVRYYMNDSYKADYVFPY